MCATCRHARRCDYGGAAGDEARRDPAAVCWAGRWPDARGEVRWARVLHSGVPKAVRLQTGLAAAWRTLKHHLAADGLYAGCGCFVGPLRIWHWLLDAAPPERALAAAGQRVAGALGWLRW